MENKVIVNINGNVYTIKGQESKEYILNIAEYVNNEIKKIINSNKKLNTLNASVLTALNIASELYKLNDECEAIKSDYQNSLLEIEKLKKEVSDNELYYNACQKKCDNILQENKKYKRDIEYYKAELLKNKEENSINKEEIKKINNECDILKKDNTKKNKEIDNLREEITDSKYKTMEMQKLLLETQLELMKIKKEYNILDT